jgi:hypothetical protein
MDSRSRIPCRFPCEIGQGRARTKGSLLDLSEGGLALVTRLAVNEGDSIRIKLYPHRREGGIVVHGLVWNFRNRARGRGGPEAPILGIMLSNAPRTYHRLLERLEARRAQGTRAKKTPRSESSPISPGAAVRHLDKANASDLASSPAGDVTIVTEPRADSPLSRPKFPLPPPKTSAPEALPLFSVRVKHRGCCL